MLSSRNIIPCNECPLRLYNDKCYNLHGCGNPHSGNVIIIPNVDFLAYKGRDLSYSDIVKDIEVTLSSTGVESESYFIIPIIRCRQIKDCPVNDDIIKRCFRFTIADFRCYEFNKILLLGEAARIFFNIEQIAPYLDVIIHNCKSNKDYFVTYNPIVKYNDEDKYEKYKNDLIRFMNYDKTNMDILGYKQVMYL